MQLNRSLAVAVNLAQRSAASTCRTLASVLFMAVILRQVFIGFSCSRGQQVMLQKIAQKRTHPLYDEQLFREDAGEDGEGQS